MPARPAAIRPAAAPSRHRRRRASFWAGARDPSRREEKPREWRPVCRAVRWERQAGSRQQGRAMRRGRERQTVDLPDPLGHKLTRAVAIVAGLAGVYVVLSVVLWALQEKITFPAPRSPLPDPVQTVGYGERIELRMHDGTRLVGWYLPAVKEHMRRSGGQESDTAVKDPGMLWFYGNGET